MARTRGTIARHARLRSPGPLRQVVAVLGVGALVGGISAAAVGAFSVYSLTATLAAHAVALDDQVAVPPPGVGPYADAFDLLIVGTDQCEAEFVPIFGDRCQGESAGDDLNDVTMLVHVSVNPRRVTVVSFPRDLMVPIPSCTDGDGWQTSAMSKQQLNTTYALGGLACVARTISDLTGEPIPFAAKVTFGGVVAITDALGGVDVCIGNGGIDDPYTGIDWPAGTRNVQGLDALAFLRTRHGVGDGSDLGRIGNQQQYMSRLARKLASDQVLTDPAELFGLATTAVQNVTSSESLANPLRIVQLALAVKDVPFDQIAFVQYPVTGDPDDPNRVVPDEDSGAVLFAALAANQPLQITGAAGSNGGVVVADAGSSADPAASADPADPAASATTPAGSVALPDDITGSTAAEQTCSAGNVSAEG